MKNYSLFWMIVWAVVLALAIVAIFWEPAIYGVIVIAAIFLVLFIHDFYKVRGI